MSFLEEVRQKKALEAKQIKEAVEAIAIANMKSDELSLKLRDCEKHEQDQLMEQDIAQRLISESFDKLSTAVRTEIYKKLKLLKLC